MEQGLSKGDGASLRDRATHEPSPPVSALRVGIASALMGLGRRAAQAYLDDPRHVSEATVRLPTRDIMDEHFARCHQEAVSLARDCLLALVADAKRFDEDIDGDETGMSVRYFIETDHHSLGELAEVLGIRAGFGETVGDALWRAIGTDPASAMSARQGQDPKGLEAQPASAVPQADAQ